MNIAQIKINLSKLVTGIEGAIESKQEAIDNCTSEARTEKLELQLSTLVDLLQIIDEAVDTADDWEA